MKIRRIAVTKSRTVNLGDYNSKKAELTLDAEIGDDEDLGSSIDALDFEINRQLDKLLESF